MWSGGGAAAPSDDVDEAAARPVADLAGELVRAEVVSPELVRKPRVRVCAHRDLGDPGELLDPRPELDRPEGAVEPRGERLRVPDRVPERLDRLPRQGTSGCVGDGPRDDDRKAPPPRLEGRLDGEDRGLCVQGVEHRLDEEEIDASRDEGVRRLLVGVAKLVEAHVAGAGSSTFGEMDAVRLVGPSTPAANRGRSGPDQAAARACAMRAPASLISAASWAVP